MQSLTIRCQNSVIGRNLFAFAVVGLLAGSCWIQRGAAQDFAELLEEEAQQSTRPLASQVPADEASGGNSSTSANKRQESRQPSVEARKQAAERVRSILGEDVARAKTAEQKSALANRFIKLAEESNDDAEQYVLFEAAQRLAYDAGNAVIATEALSAVEQRFGLDLSAKRSEMLIRLAREATPATASEIADLLLAEARDRLRGADVSTAIDLAKAAAIACRRGRDGKRQKQAVELIDELRDQQQILAQIKPFVEKLNANPRDAEAAAKVGRFKCLRLGEWEAGLPLLQRGDDQQLASLAKLEAQANKTPAELEQLGSSWKAVAASLESPEKEAALERALSHLTAARDSLQGLARVKATKAIEDIQQELYGDTAEKWLVVFFSQDPTIWNTSTNRGPQDFAVPIARTPPNLRYVRLRRSPTDFVILEITQPQLVQTVTTKPFGWQGSKVRLATSETTPLGIIDFRKSTKGTSQSLNLYLTPDREGRFGGWGFGGNANQPGAPLTATWNGQQMPLAPIEIAVSNKDLSTPESSFLLR